MNYVKHNMFHDIFLTVGLMIVMICFMGPTCDHFCYGTNRLAIFFIVPQNNVFKIMCSIESRCKKVMIPPIKSELIKMQLGRTCHERQ